MAKKKVVAEKVPLVLNEELHEETKAIAAGTNELELLFDPDEGEVLAAEHIGRVVDLLSLSREMGRRIEEDYKEKIKDIPDPFKPFATERKALNSKLAATEAALEQNLRDYLTLGHITPEGYESKAGCRLSMVGKKSLVIDDASKIPEEFLLPLEQRVDKVKLATYMQAQADLAEAAQAAKVDVAANPLADCAHFTTIYTFRTKVPQEVE